MNKKLSLLALCAFTLMGCGSTSVFGDTPQATVYNLGQNFTTAANAASVVVQFVPIPAEGCKVIHGVADAFRGAESTVRDPNFQGDTNAQVIVVLENAVATAIRVFADVAAKNPNATALQRTSPPPAAISAPPADDQWNSLNASLNAAITALRC